MNVIWHRLLLGLVPVVGLIWLIAFFVFPGFSPLSPHLSPLEVAGFYSDPDNAARVRYSMVVFNWFEVGMIPLYATICLLMQRMSHGNGPLSWVYLACSLNATVMFAAANMFWLVAAYRPDRAPDAVALLNDLGWIFFVAPVGFLLAQNTALAFAIFFDRSIKPVFPRWVGWFNVAVGLCWLPSCFAVAMLDGPLAWDGPLAYSLRVIAFMVYIAVMFLVTWKAWDRIGPGQQVPV